MCLVQSLSAAHSSSRMLLDFVSSQVKKYCCCFWDLSFWNIPDGKFYILRNHRTISLIIRSLIHLSQQAFTALPALMTSHFTALLINYPSVKQFTVSAVRLVRPFSCYARFRMGGFCRPSCWTPPETEHEHVSPQLNYALSIWQQLIFLFHQRAQSMFWHSSPFWKAIMPLSRCAWKEAGGRSSQAFEIYRHTDTLCMLHIRLWVSVTNCQRSCTTSCSSQMSLKLVTESTVGFTRRKKDHRSTLWVIHVFTHLSVE